MDRQIIAFVNGIKKDKNLSSYDEESTRQALIMKPLFLLGWNIFDVNEVKPNVLKKNRGFDYALLSDDVKKVLIKVKKAGEQLAKCPPEFLVSAAGEGAEIFILTNGIEWWLYLVSEKTKYKTDRFCSISVLKQKAEQVAEHLVTFLDKENVTEGHASAAARTLLTESLQKIFQEAIPEAWRKMVAESHAGLIKLLGETTEKVCGYYPENQTVIKFLNNGLNHQPRAAISSPRETPVATAAFVRTGVEENPVHIPQKNNGQSPSLFSFKGQEYKLKSWSDMLIRICEVLKNEYQQNVENLQWHSVGRKYYFSKNKSDLRFPEKINGTEIYVETYLSPGEATRAAFSMVQFFGYSKEDFVIASGKN